MNGSRHPWLDIPAEDYEGHMASPAVAQLQLLDALFRDVLTEFRPASLAVLGCATGNGFRHLEHSPARVVGVDINADFLGILRRRYAPAIPRLELYCADVADESRVYDPVDLVFAALLFEYVDLAGGLRHVTRHLAGGGVFVAALQRQGTAKSSITPGPYRSLDALKPVFRLREPGEFIAACAGLGLRRFREDVLPMKQGKELYVGYFRAGGGP